MSLQLADWDYGIPILTRIFPKSEKHLFVVNNLPCPFDLSDTKATHIPLHSLTVLPTTVTPANPDQPKYVSNKSLFHIELYRPEKGEWERIQRPNVSWSAAKAQTTFAGEEGEYAAPETLLIPPGLFRVMRVSETKVNAVSEEFRLDLQNHKESQTIRLE